MARLVVVLTGVCGVDWGVMARSWVRQQIKTLIPDKIPGLMPWAERLARLPLPIQWQFWGSCAVATSTVVGAVAFSLLLHQPAIPDRCDRVFWPFASASFRLYCAQVAAAEQTPEALLEAIRLVDALPGDHPLRPMINQRIEAWSTQVLDLSEASFHAGRLESAIAAVEQIPRGSTAYPQVQERVARWRKVWAEGEGIYQRALAALTEQSWRRAFAISLGLQDVDNRYWAVDQFERLNRRIVAAQMDESRLSKGRRLLLQGGLDNLIAALDIAQSVGPNSDYSKSARELTDTVATALMRVAEVSLAQQDLQMALAAAQAIPRQTSPWESAQDFIELAYATSWTWDDTILGVESAIIRARRLLPNRPLFWQAQELISQWQADVQALRILEKAMSLAEPETIPNLRLAIAQMQQVPFGISDYRRRASEKQVLDWLRQLQTLEDRPVLDQAEQLAASGRPDDLQRAIALMQNIQVGRALYSRAQASLISWRKELAMLTASPTPTLDPPPPHPPWLNQSLSYASQGTPASLAQAIQLANQVAMDSPQRPEAERMMKQWGEEILNLARVEATTNLQQAIAIAQQVPPVSYAFNEAQTLIQSWQR